MRARQVAVVGSGLRDDGLAETAEEVGRLLAEAGAVVVCGGLRGVMEAAARGAADAGGDVIGIVPSADPEDANPHCSHVVATSTGTARNLAVVASAEAVIAVGGAWGTLSEIALARNIDRPVIALGSWAIEPPETFEGELGVVPAQTPAEAVALALDA
jgi:uncharacterized protein (TIGR00725 family)